MLNRSPDAATRTAHLFSGGFSLRSLSTVKTVALTRLPSLSTRSVLSHVAKTHPPEYAGSTFYSDLLHSVNYPFLDACVKRVTYDCSGPGTAFGLCIDSYL
jgi:hypothetical protein